eukprot:gene15796-21920_t
MAGGGGGGGGWRGASGALISAPAALLCPVHAVMSSKDVSKDMGQLLLKGWTMLAENCPPCQVPLMRDPKSKDRLCVNCKKSYKANEPLPDVDSDFSDVEESQDKDEAPKIAEASGRMESGGAAATN